MARVDVASMSAVKTYEIEMQRIRAMGNDHGLVLAQVDATVLPYTQPNGRHGHLSGHETYLVGGHLPGAVFADLIDEFSDPDGRYPFTRPGAERPSAAVLSGPKL